MMSLWSVLVTCVQLVLWVHTGDAVMSCTQNGDLDFRPIPCNCTVYYQCVKYTLNKLTCEPGTVFSPEKKVCVVEGSADDTCTTASFDGEPRLIPDESRCSLYYNCSEPAKYYFWEENLQECGHPQVYNPNTRRCEHYSMVNCGEREMPLGPCEYKIRECVTAHCRPCYVDNPSCRDLADGLHPEPEYISFTSKTKFIVCQDQRLVYHGQCIVYDGREQIFDPARKSCVLV